MFFTTAGPRRVMAALSSMLITAAGATAAPGDADEGRALYMEYCATCHAPQGDGTGPMAGVLMVKPADLTALAAEDPDGRFPRARVVRRIDGRDPLVSHGSPMPVYGFFFEGRDTTLRTASGQPIMTSQPVADIVAFLETIQD